jgi:hypothetical protein
MDRDEVRDLAGFVRRLRGGAADSFELYSDLADAIAEDGGAADPWDGLDLDTA